MRSSLRHNDDNKADHSGDVIDEEWMEDLNLKPLSSVANAPELNRKAKSKFKSENPPKKKKLLITVAVCILMHTRSKKANLMQSALGFYLQSSHCPKEVMTVLHQLGLCV